MQKLWAPNKPPSMLNDALADVSVGGVHAFVVAWRRRGVGVPPPTGRPPGGAHWPHVSHDGEAAGLAHQQGMVVALGALQTIE